MVNKNELTGEWLTQFVLQPLHKERECKHLKRSMTVHLNSELQDIMDLICVFPLECAQPAGVFFFFDWC